MAKENNGVVINYCNLNLYTALFKEEEMIKYTNHNFLVDDHHGLPADSEQFSRILYDLLLNYINDQFDFFAVVIPVGKQMSVANSFKQLCLETIKRIDSFADKPIYGVNESLSEGVSVGRFSFMLIKMKGHITVISVVVNGELVPNLTSYYPCGLLNLVEWLKNDLEETNGEVYEDHDVLHVLLNECHFSLDYEVEKRAEKKMVKTMEFYSDHGTAAGCVVFVMIFDVCINRECIFDGILLLYFIIIYTHFLLLLRNLMILLNLT
eukprot:TRINITY_DN2454_c0_g1_i2.p1 TRINITY_DN2454_c0_g1~~TRINITY_DN2454_c0_g1_i2.p1  ORF type:complete len:265 (-),score=46.63 TRINITY_DN2454_c0_g1_i2:668-1462(-)